MRHQLLLAPVAALFAVTFGCGEKPAPPVIKERPALTLIVRATSSSNPRVLSGEVRARHETQPGFRVGGKLVERLVDAGSVVKAGQPLARIDPADILLQVTLAETQLRLATEEVLRFRDLRNRNFVSQSALDAKESALAAAAAQADLARNQKEYTTLRADHTGIVAAVLAEPGQVLGPGQPVFRLIRDGEREVAIAIPEAQVSALKIDAAAEITFDTQGTPATTMPGRLRELSPSADPASRTFAARVSIIDGDNRLPLGLTARVKWVEDKTTGDLLVPLSAIYQQGRQQAAVWVVATDHSVNLRPVQISAYRDNGAVISNGLTAGERIVRAGVHKLTAGEKIVPVDEDPR